MATGVLARVRGGHHARRPAPGHRADLGNERADVVGSRRVPEAAWLELVAAVADDLVDRDGTVHEGTTVPIGPTGSAELVTARGGYLYAFANDAWPGYASNGGAVALRVTRVT